MDTHTFIEALRDLPLEEGRIFIEQHTAELTDHVAVSNMIKEESTRQSGIHLATALKLAELLIYFGEYLRNDLLRASGLLAKGNALSFYGLEQAAMQMFDDAGNIFLGQNDEVSWARTRIGWIVSSAWIGEVEDALQVAAEARDVLERHQEPYWMCIIDHNTAVIYTQIGQYHKALEIYERMLAVYPTITNRGEDFMKRAVAMVKVNQARNLTWLGRFDQAQALLETALASFQEAGFIMLVNKAELNMALIDYARGFYGSALRRYYQARVRGEQHHLDDASASAFIELQIATCLIKLNRSEEAARLAVKAVQTFRELDSLLEVGAALQEAASIFIASGQQQEALTALNEASQLFEQGGLDHHAVTTKIKQAAVLLETGDYTQAYEKAMSLQIYCESQGIMARAIEATLIMAEARVGQIQQGWGQADVDIAPLMNEAGTLCDKIAELARSHHLHEQFYKSQYLQGQLAVLRGDLAKADAYYVIAIQSVEQILDDLVFDLRHEFLRSTWKIYEDMIGLCLQQGQVERAFYYLERARSVALRQYLSHARQSNQEIWSKNAAVLRMQNELNEWQQRHHFYSAQLADLDAHPSSSVDRQALQHEQRLSEEKISELFEHLHLLQYSGSEHTAGQDALDSDAGEEWQTTVTTIQMCLEQQQTMLAYFLYKGRLIIFVVTRERVIIYEHEDGMAELERLLPPLYARLDPKGWHSYQQPHIQATRKVLQKLYALLIAPLVHELPQESGLLTIVPYGPLHNVPFQALYDGAHYLVETVQLHYLPASSILPHMQTSMPQQTAGKALVFGYSGQGELQRALEEAQSIATMLDGSCYLEQEATIERLLQEVEGCPVIHLATHGKSRLDAPNFSYVRLADGQLNAIDAFNLRLDGCELVTLSGCETGLALSSGGDEQIGLGRAFLAAGASSLVMSSWPVEDVATNEMMQTFYEHLLRGESRVQALQLAQRYLLQHPSGNYAHPYFWAAFRLIGATGALKTIQPKASPVPVL